MRRLFITFIVALLIIPTIAFAQDKSPQPKTAAVTITYHWRAVYNYQATNSWWWTGLAIRNRPNPNYMLIHLLDGDGVVRGEGTFYLGANNEEAIAVLEDFVDTGYVPTVGSVWIYGTNDFSTTMFVGNGSGGFSMFEKEPVNYQ